VFRSILRSGTAPRENSPYGDFEGSATRITGVVVTKGLKDGRRKAASFQFVWQRQNPKFHSSQFSKAAAPVQSTYSWRQK
jgi:hypothetical protein